MLVYSNTNISAVEAMISCRRSYGNITQTPYIFKFARIDRKTIAIYIHRFDHATILFFPLHIYSLLV